jgi:hypothetical protein
MLHSGLEQLLLDFGSFGSLGLQLALVLEGQLFFSAEIRHEWS